MSNESFLRNCVIRARTDDGPTFKVDSLVVARLDGYAILPREEFEATEKQIEELTKEAAEYKQSLEVMAGYVDDCDARVGQLKTRIAELEAAQEWRPRERRPDPSESVEILVQMQMQNDGRRHHRIFSSYVIAKFDWDREEERYFAKVLGWRPLL